MLAYILGITKWGNRGLQISAGFRDYKLRQERFEIGAEQLLGIEIWYQQSPTNSIEHRIYL